MGSFAPVGFSSEIADVIVARFSHRNDFECYLQRLIDERNKIVVFNRDLPFTIELVDQVVMKAKVKLGLGKRSDAAEPVLEEFIPMKSSSSEDETKEIELNENKKENEIVTSTDKRDWMSSVQLWSSDNSNNQNQCPNTPFASKSNRIGGLKLESNDKKKAGEEMKWPLVGSLNAPVAEKPPARTAFLPFKGGASVPVIKEAEIELPKVSGLTLCTPEMKQVVLMEEVMCNGFSSKSGSSSGSQSHSARKQRRCWSPELHRRFVNALQQLGGAQAATPKQIRELMQVDGLTNDEVKSHLQKFRLHSRKSNGKNPGPLDLWPSPEPFDESSKPSNSQSGSPPGPLELTGSRDTSMMTLSMGDEYDEKNESNWKNQIHLCG